MVSAGGSDGEAGQTGDTARETARGSIRLSPVLKSLDHATVWVEKPVRRLAGPARLNPLPHAGSISVFLLGVVVISGLYITLFFEYGYVASYDSVASMEGHAIQRVMRALHRYASAALVITTLIHGWRIFTARRFVGRQRRLRWATGVAAVALVWLAGVTGYWMVWDVRAQALNEVVIGFIGRTDLGAGIAINQLGVLGDRPGSGSGFLLALWFVHLLLTGAIGFFVFRHLRRSNLTWLPPRLMMALMGGALVIVSLGRPVGMLAPAQPDRLIGKIPVDPFVLFLLPPLLSSGRGVALVFAMTLLLVVLVLPRLLRRRDPEPVIIDEQACTGCEFCVIDCPYQALAMNGSEENPLAVVDEQRCVSCGICLGSCAFGAIELPGFDPTPPLAVAGKHLVIACSRHVEDDLPSIGESALHRVSCAGAVAPSTVQVFMAGGATGVQLVGCAPNDCRFGLGNTMAEARLSGQRRPHPAPKYARAVTQDWVSTDRVTAALQEPGSSSSADGEQTRGSREALVGVGLVAVATAAGVALATQAPFDSAFDDSTVRVVIDHGDGEVLRAAPELGPIGSISGLDLVAGEEVFGTVSSGGDDGWSAVIDVRSPEVEAKASLLVYAVEDGRRILLLETLFDKRADARTLVDLTDVPPRQTVADGERIFTSRAGGCDVCHSVTPHDDGVGPSLAGVASMADQRVDGLTAEQYFRQSILLPDQYVVEGWPAGQMLPIYRDQLSAEELDAIISYLLTLENETDGGES